MKILSSSILILALILAFNCADSKNLLKKGPGEQADDFTLKGTDGASYNLSDALNKSDYVVVMFWSAECPYVQPYTERINSIVGDYSSKGITFWGVNANSTESIEEVKTHAGEKGYVFPMLKDVNNIVADMLGATRTPEVYVINKDKTILYHGSIDNNRDASKVTANHLRNALDEILDGRDVSVNNTKFFGCTIKRVEK